MEEIGTNNESLTGLFSLKWCLVSSLWQALKQSLSWTPADLDQILQGYDPCSTCPHQHHQDCPDLTSIEVSSLLALVKFSHEFCWRRELGRGDHVLPVLLNSHSPKCQWMKKSPREAM